VNDVRRRRSRWAIRASAVFLTACASGGSPNVNAGAARAAAAIPDTSSTRRSVADTLPGLVPPGFGTLKQDDVSLRLQSSSLQVRAMPLDESIIRLLSPDSYRAMSELKRSKQDAIAAVARRNAVRELSLWYVSFFAVEQGETRFSPREFIVRNVGRDFRPLEVIPLTPGFGEQRLRQNGRQDALYVFDGQLDPQQPLTIGYATAQNDEWRNILPQIERERARVRGRAAAGRSP